MRTLRSSTFLCGALFALPVLADERPRVAPVSNPQVAAEGDILNDSSALDDGNIEYIEPIFGVVQPGAVLIEWAPPALLVEDVGIAPSDAAVWAGGYWDWYDNEWCWARGRWIVPPQPGYSWNAPYYENRGGRVVYVGGYWRAANAPFTRPTNLSALARTNPTWKHGPPAVGANGTFVPAPPGSKPGLVVPAPAGTPPRVMASQPAIVRSGMAVRAAADGRFEVRAPQGVVRSGQRIEAQVGAQPARSGEKGFRPALADTSKTPVRAPAKIAQPNLDPARAAERTVERERAPRAAAVSSKPTGGNVPREVPRTPVEHGMSAMPQREAPLRGEGTPRTPVPAGHAGPERAPVERGPLGPVERGPVGPTGRGSVGPAARGPVGPVEHGPLGDGERAPGGVAGEVHPMESRPGEAAQPVAAPHAGAAVGGGEAHHR